MKVLVLHGGDSPEREISFKSAKGITEALDKLQIEYEVFDPIDGESQMLEACRRADVVLPIMHGVNVEDGKLQKVLEENNIAFLGSNSRSSDLSFDKQKTHKVLEAKGIRMPRFAIVSLSDMDHELFSSLFVLKPYNTGSSVDTLIAREVNDENLETARQLLRKYDSMLLEELVVGREITVPVLDGGALPVIYIVPPEGEEFDLENKYNGKTQEICPVPFENISEEVQKTAQELTVEVYNALDCRHLGRVDMIIDGNNNLYVLELNTIPGLTSQSLYPVSAKVAGYSMEDLVQKFINMVERDK